jgi:hypothetical protein
LGAQAELPVRAEAAEVARATAEAAVALVALAAVVVLVAAALAVVRLAQAAAWAQKVAPAEVAEAGLEARRQTPKWTRVLRVMLRRLTSRPMTSERRIRAVTVAVRARSHTEP